MDMLHWIQSLAVLIVALSATDAQFLPHYYAVESQESAVSINDAPVGLYKKTQSYRGSEEYGVSLGGAPVAIYGKQSAWPRIPFYAPVPWTYWPDMYPLDYECLDVDYDVPMYSSPPEPTSPDSDVGGILPRSFRGSVSVASSNADATQSKTNAEAISVQGSVASDVIKNLLNL